YKEKSDFILQPMTGAATLRGYLAENGFEVQRETATTENDKVYSVMLCRFDGIKRKLSPAGKRIGILRPTTDDNKEYIFKQLKIVEKCIKDLQTTDKNADFLKENIIAQEEILKLTEG
ncbi:MAG: tRNA (adenine(22)-N(1))-methyltransferase TrmK, partial [Clostridia bacterium]|nr:tRNA (adenine(22)-N(1))-methyltransferase TrmK [Clostridia bacterium]MBP0989758.1 tRNA (adenine(22)-N(1))-methyltransferase TrmK [Oscillospiraceae bacterium]